VFKRVNVAQSSARMVLSWVKSGIKLHQNCVVVGKVVQNTTRTLFLWVKVPQNIPTIVLLWVKVAQNNARIVLLWVKVA
jgi:hypothetical protein